VFNRVENAHSAMKSRRYSTLLVSIAENGNGIMMFCAFGNK
jgi:hypothetical protein